MDQTTLILAVGMLVTGTANTILNKWQDMQCVDNCTDPDPSKHVLWEQPVIQTLNMFTGELFCLVAAIFMTYWNRVNRAEYVPVDEDHDNKLPLTGWKRTLLWLPTLCDMCSTTLLNVGLLYVAASIFQMLRGGIVLFTGLFSVIFLGRRIPAFQWFALGMVTLGIALVGAASILNAPAAHVAQASASKEALGVLLILIALLFGAGMFVIEERILSHYRVDPLEGVGLEGLFGTLTVVAASPFLYIFWGREHKGGFLDVVTGWDHFWGTPMVWQIGLMICFSIAGFNFFGLSVTKRVSSTARATIDASRTLFIWMISLYLGWETFKWLQVGGFVLLIYGTFLYNGVVSPPGWLSSSDGEDDEHVVYHPRDGEEAPILNGARHEDY